VTRACTTLPLGLLAVLAMIGAGCGGTDTTSPAPPPEVAQPLPKLPARWHVHRDRSIGYAIGIPRGWKVKPSRYAVLIRSPDHLVAVSLAVDRSDATLELPPEQFAARALAALPGFAGRLEPSRPRPFGGTPLDGVQTVAKGRTESRGIKARATLIVLRHDSFVNYSVAVVENALRGYSRRDRAVALKMIRTLRDQPVEASPSSETT